ncbi:MAG: hypothetical protein PVH88_17895 [Ignavibacteria bacterium]|jgi:hypothetical protein
MKYLLNILLVILCSTTLLFSQTKYEHHINRITAEVSDDGALLYRKNTVLYPTWPYDSRYFDFDARKTYQESWGVWLGTKDFLGVNDTVPSDAVVACGNYYTDKSNIVTLSLQKRVRYDYPTVRVSDGSDVKNESYDAAVVVKSLDCDEQIESVWTTSLGLTVQLKTYAYAVEGHKNYIIYDYKFINTGNVDDNTLTKELSTKLTDVWFGFSFNTDIKPKFGGVELDDNYEYYGDDYDEWLDGNSEADSARILIAWDGDYIDTDSYDPDPITGEPRVPGYYGLGVLHADKQAVDDLESGSSDDPALPKNVTDASGLESSASAQIQKMSQGGNENFAGYGADNFIMGFGSYDIPLNEDVRIVLVQMIDGISREKAEELGVKLLAGEITQSEYEDEIATGRDSLFNTFNAAKIAYDNRYDISDPLPSPDSLLVTSGVGRITLEWSASSETAVDPDANINDFAGYRIYRAAITPDNPWELLYEMGGDSGNPIEHVYIDSSIIMGFDYYYAVTTFDDGTQNELNPGVSLESSRLTSTAYAGVSASRAAQTTSQGFKNNLRVVPNPYNIRSQNYGDPNDASDTENNKLLFVGLPEHCTIRIFTVSGDLVKTIYHTSGLGSEEWDQITDSNQFIVSGLYIAHIESDLGNEIIKFVVIR